MLSEQPATITKPKLSQHTNHCAKLYKSNAKWNEERKTQTGKRMMSL